MRRQHRANRFCRNTISGLLVIIIPLRLLHSWIRTISVGLLLLSTLDHFLQIDNTNRLETDSVTLPETFQHFPRARVSQIAVQGASLLPGNRQDKVTYQYFLKILIRKILNTGLLNSSNKRRSEAGNGMCLEIWCISGHFITLLYTPKNKSPKNYFPFCEGQVWSWAKFNQTKQKGIKASLSCVVPL